MLTKENQTIADEMAENLRRIFGIKKIPSKQRTIGLEAEFMILNNEGRMSNEADLIIKKSSNFCKKECAKNMIEIDTLPSKTIRGTMTNMLEKTENALDEV